MFIPFIFIFLLVKLIFFYFILPTINPHMNLPIKMLTKLVSAINIIVPIIPTISEIIIVFLIPFKYPIIILLNRHPIKAPRGTKAVITAVYFINSSSSHLFILEITF